MSAERLKSTVGLALVGLIALYGGWTIVQAKWLGPRAELRADIEDLEGTLARFRAADPESIRAERRRREIAGLTLGGNREIVDHRVRTRLNLLARTAGLAPAAVGTSSPKAVESPMRREFPRRGYWGRLRDQADLVELEASVSGEGTLEEAATLIGAIEAEPWPVRVESVRLTPRADGRRFRVSLALRTFYLPGMGPADDAAVDPLDVLPAAPALPPAILASFVATNPFTLPEPPPPPPAPKPKPPAPKPPPPDPGPPPFPYADWRVTGVAEGPAGPEAWLRNARTNETRVLAVGTTLGDVRIVAVEADAIAVEQNGVRTRVVVGDVMSRRAAIDG